MSPTVNGRALIRQAQIVLDEVERLKALARAGQDPLQGPFHLGVIPTAGPYLLPLLLPVLRQRWPQLQLLLREELTAGLLERLRAGSLDAAILSLPLDGADLRWESLLSESILVALPRHHPLAGRARVAPGALSTEPVILLEEGHCLRDQSVAVCDAVGLGHRRDDAQAAGLEIRRKVAANGDDRAAYVDAVGIVRSWMRMAGMIEIVKQRRNQQVADLPRGKTVTIEVGRLVAQPGHMRMWRRL